MTRGDRRLTLGVLIVGAVLTVIASRDSWFTVGSGFYGPDGTLMWVLDGAAAVLALCALAALIRESAALEYLAAMAGVMLAGALLAGALLVLLVVSGGGTDQPDRGGWLAAVAAAAVGGGGVGLLAESGPIGPRLRIAVVVLVVASAAAAVLLPPDWTRPEVQIIR